MKVKRRKPPEPHIPFISLADIAWQVIIFFFMAASFTKIDAMMLESPSATSENKPQAEEQKHPTVVAAADGSLTLDGHPVALSELTNELVQSLKDKTKPADRLVALESSDDITFQLDTQIEAAIKKAGASPLILSSDTASGPQQ